LSGGLPDSEAGFITPENVFLLLQSSMAEGVTPPQQTLGLAHADLRLVCKLPTVLVLRLLAEAV
jgi:hypothetical protein